MVVEAVMFNDVMMFIRVVDDSVETENGRIWLETCIFQENTELLNSVCIFSPVVEDCIYFSVSGHNNYGGKTKCRDRLTRYVCPHGT